MSPNTIGALLMIASMACFTFNDTLLKMTDGALPLFQLLFLLLFLLFLRWFYMGVYYKWLINGLLRAIRLAGMRLV